MSSKAVVFGNQNVKMSVHLTKLRVNIIRYVGLVWIETNVYKYCPQCYISSFREDFYYVQFISEVQA